MSRRAVILLLGLAGLALGLAPGACGGAPRWIWNASASAPLGLYRLGAAEPLAVGRWVAVTPPADLAETLAAREALPKGALLIKRVAALAPSEVCRTGAIVRLDGARAAGAVAQDRRGRPLPRWAGCSRLRADEVFLLNPAPDSFDSRYFGALPRRAVVGQVVRVWPQKAPPDGR